MDINSTTSRKLFPMVEIQGIRTMENYTYINQFINTLGKKSYELKNPRSNIGMIQNTMLPKKN